jgi:phosphonate transport system substrate-binding protein
VFYTTPAFYDYNWSVSARMPAPLREQLRQAFLDLSPDTADGKEILSLQRASRFIPTRPENYEGIEAAARSAGLL